MRYLYMPLASEELSVRGRYEVRAGDGTLLAQEEWGRYRNPGSDVETMRSEWQGDAGTLLGHTLFSPSGIERAHLRWRPAGGAPRSRSLTFEARSVWLRRDGAHEEIPLPAGSGVMLPVIALARHALPFELSVEDVRRPTVLRLGWPDEAWMPTAAAARLEPRGFCETTWRGERLRLKGWHASAWDQPTQALWFDRNGTCLAWQMQTGERPWHARLVSWTTFG